MTFCKDKTSPKIRITNQQNKKTPKKVSLYSKLVFNTLNYGKN